MENLGLYIHIPFCKSRCPYCDFYSMRAGSTDFDSYTQSIIRSMTEWSQKLNRKADTLYFGGGTPSLLGAKNICLLTEKAKKLFGVDGEITVECNPSAVEDDFFDITAQSGVNRISLGMQSAVDSERKKLGRSSNRQTVMKRISQAKKSGIENISLDVMLGVPDQTSDSLKATADFCIEADVPHISAYMLKIEENTFFFKNREKLNLPDDDTVADMYLMLGDELEKNGFVNYEISNFAKKGFEGRHNLKYWNAEEYLGIGPSAHSFVDGKRFYYPRDSEFFINGNAPVDDGTGGDEEEYIMLRLRLADGIIFEEFEKRFNRKISENLIKKAKKYADMELTEVSENSVRFTRKGFLVSNTIISELLNNI